MQKAISISDISIAVKGQLLACVAVLSQFQPATSTKPISATVTDEKNITWTLNYWPGTKKGFDGCSFSLSGKHLYEEMIYWINSQEDLLEGKVSSSLY